jgi:hypothetical protein
MLIAIKAKRRARNERQLHRGNDQQGRATNFSRTVPPACQAVDSATQNLTVETPAPNPDTVQTISNMSIDDAIITGNVNRQWVLHIAQAGSPMLGQNLVQAMLLAYRKKKKSSKKRERRKKRQRRTERTRASRELAEQEENERFAAETAEQRDGSSLFSYHPLDRLMRLMCPESRHHHYRRRRFSLLHLENQKSKLQSPSSDRES